MLDDFDARASFLVVLSIYAGLAINPFGERPSLWQYFLTPTAAHAADGHVSAIAKAAAEGDLLRAASSEGHEWTDIIILSDSRDGRFHEHTFHSLVLEFPLSFQ